MIRRILLIAAMVAAPLMVWSTAGTARADTPVATISGCYDCLGYFDTPVLQFNNTTGGTLTNAQIVLNGYQGLNNGQTTTVNLGSLGATTVFEWGSLPGAPNGTTPFNLTAYDYDDEFIGTSYIINDPTCGQPGLDGGTGCVDGGGAQWYADVGNFNVTFTATVSGGAYDGQSVYSVFSPASNATGGFVGWEGLDPLGYSESPYDIHSGVITGDLANIYLGLPPAPGGVPEPATWALMIGGFGLIGTTLRSKRRQGFAQIRAS